MKKTASESKKVKREIIFNGFKGEVETREDETEYRTVLHTLYTIAPSMGPDLKTIDVELFFKLNNQEIFQLENTALKEVQTS